MEWEIFKMDLIHVKGKSVSPGVFFTLSLIVLLFAPYPFIHSLLLSIWSIQYGQRQSTCNSFKDWIIVLDSILLHSF